MAGQSWIRGKLLGAGAFGSVNLAIQREDGAVFAAKSVAVDANSEASVRAIENEITLLQALDSDFVVRCLGSDWTEENGQLMRNVFLEYMPEGCLTDFLNQFAQSGALDEHLIRTYTRSIVEGIQYLHSHNIVHCDIKGKNILVGSGHVKLTDFGSAKRDSGGDANRGANSGTNSGGNCKVSGTPLWMAPEVVRQVEQGPASDIWSLGCTVVEMATGRAPWRNLAGMNQFVALYHIGCTDDLPPVPAWLSPDAHDFLSHCFQRDPLKRWTSTQLLQHPFLTTRFVDKAMHLEPPSPVSVMQFPDDCDTNFSVPTLAAPPSLLKRKFATQLVSAASATVQEIVQENWCPNWGNSSASSGRWIVVRSPPGSPKRSAALSDCMTPISGSGSLEPCEDSETSCGGFVEESSVRSVGARSVDGSFAVVAARVAEGFNGDDLNAVVPMATGVDSAGSELDVDCVGARFGADCEAGGLLAEFSISFGLVCGNVCSSSEYLVVVNRYSNPQILLYWRHSCERSDWENCWKCGFLDQCGLLDEYTFALVLKKSIISINCMCECVLSLDIFRCIDIHLSLYRVLWRLLFLKRLKMSLGLQQQFGVTASFFMQMVFIIHWVRLLQTLHRNGYLVWSKLIITSTFYSTWVVGVVL